MKVVLVVKSFPVLSQTFINRHLIGLIERGIDVHVICAKSHNSDWKKFPALDKTALKPRVRATHSRARRFAWPLLWPLTLGRCLFQNSAGTLRYLRFGWEKFGVKVLIRFYFDAEFLLLCPDLVHFEFGDVARERSYLREATGLKTLMSLRGADINFAGLDDATFYTQVWPNVEAIHVLGEDLWRRALYRGCPPEMQHAFIPPSVYAEHFSPTPRLAAEIGTSARPVRILSVGRLVWKKGHEYAIQAVRYLEDAGIACEMRIIGKGVHHLEVLATICDLELQRTVSLLGARTHDEVRDEMQWADIFLHAAVSEGFCNAVLEAQAMALPVVTSDADGLRDNVADGVSGFVVPRRDARALAEKITVLTQDAALRVRMGEAGRQRVCQHFAPAREIDDFERFYLSLMKEG